MGDSCPAWPRLSSQMMTSRRGDMALDRSLSMVFKPAYDLGGTCLISRVMPSGSRK